MPFTDVMALYVSIQSAAGSLRALTQGRIVSTKSTCIIGLKAICGQCEKETWPSNKEQLALFSNASITCPSCKRPQKLPWDQRDTMLAKGNPAKGYRWATMGLGLFTVTSCGLVLIGGIPEGVFMLAMIIFIGGNFIVSFGYKAVTEDLVVKLVDGE